MERKTTYTFSEDEIRVLKEALAMYAGYKMDMSDVSAFDWFEYMKGNRNR